MFRGGVLESGDGYWLYNEDGTLNNNNFRITYVTSDGIERDENGNAIDPRVPSVSTILIASERSNCLIKCNVL